VRADVEPETRHYNTILRAEAVFTGLIVARDTLQEMVEGVKGPHIFPDIESFNALLEVPPPPPSALQKFLGC